jgi:hypothetical protein
MIGPAAARRRSSFALCHRLGQHHGVIRLQSLRNRWRQARARYRVLKLMEHTFFHAFDATNPIASNNLYIHKGKIPSISAMRQAQPELADALSPYQAFTQERLKEDVFERIRVQEFPDRPTRLGGLFLFATRESAEACNAEWWGGKRVILEARIVGASRAGIFDARQLNATQDQWEAAARRYWAREFTSDPRPEVLVDGVIELVGWEPYARLGGFGEHRPQST